MYFISKFIWVIFAPLNFLVILLVIGFLFNLIGKKIFSKIIYIFSLLFFILVGIFPTGNLLLFKLEQYYQPPSIIPNYIDGVLILGGPSSAKLTIDYNQVSFNEAGERLIESIKIIKNNNPKKIIFSGGSIKQTFNNSHAYVANKFYSEMGIDISQITFEFKSRNTYENILFSKKIAQPKKDEIWLIITSSFHMRRAMNISKKLEWKFIAYPVDFRTGKELISLKPNFNLLENFNSFNLASHEIVGLISYFILGRSSKIF